MVDDNATVDASGREPDRRNDRLPSNTPNEETMTTAQIPERVRRFAERTMREAEAMQDKAREVALTLGRSEAAHRNRSEMFDSCCRQEVASRIRRFRCLCIQHGIDPADACSEVRDPVAHQLACGGPA